MDVGTTAVPVRSAGLIQNLGPDDLFVGEGSVTADDGVRVAVDQALAVGQSNGSLFAISSGESDVRVLGRATGIFASPAAS